MFSREAAEKWRSGWRGERERRGGEDDKENGWMGKCGICEVRDELAG